VIIPKQNEPDLEDVPEEVRRQMVFHPVESLEEVLKVALSRSDLDVLTGPGALAGV
jgi:ATP-dependent Lon protease